MQDDLFQQVATLALIGGAALYVVRRVWAVFQPETAGSGCGGGGCSSCPSNADSRVEAPPPQVVSIGMPGRNGSGPRPS